MQLGGGLSASLARSASAGRQAAHATPSAPTAALRGRSVGSVVLNSCGSMMTASRGLCRRQQQAQWPCFHPRGSRSAAPSSLATFTRVLISSPSGPMPASYRSFVTASRPLLQSPYSASSPLLRERDGGERLMQRIKRLRLFKRKHNTPVPFVLVTIMLSSAGMTMAFTPLYDLFCQTTGYDGTTQVHKDYAPPPNPTSKASKKLLTVDFVATLGGDFPWEFKPCQKRIVVTPGETALAFFKAKNLTNEPLIGMSLYSCMPPEIGIYFNKIQCFCFEEQLLNPGEEIDMPVFFFIDPEIMEDPRLDVVENITLSYIFYSSESEVPPEYAHLQLAQRTDKVPLTPEVEV